MRRRAALGAACLLACAGARGAVEPGPAVAPRMEFTPPQPGTYRLQSIQSVRDATLLDEHGTPAKLSTLTKSKVTLLTFFYTYCVDPLGCPFARETMSALRDRILADRKLAQAVRFVSISCDPTNDTPKNLGAFAAQLTRDAPLEWRFLTARSVPDLLPVLDDFGQDVSVDVDEQGHPTRTLHHMLKVFLIDARGMVREIYSVAYIQPEVMLNDIRTLYLEQSP